MNKDQLKEEINKTLGELSEAVRLFDLKKLNTVPFEKSWTGGQVVQHLILSNGGFAEVMNGPATKTVRPIDEKVENIKSTFLNFDVKLQSPEFIIPEARDYQKDLELKTLETIKNNINRIIDEKNLDETCTSFEVPVLGQLTRWECLHFVLYHTQRHIRQLKNIFLSLQNNASNLVKKETL